MTASDDEMGESKLVKAAGAVRRGAERRAAATGGRESFSARFRL